MKSPIVASILNVVLLLFVQTVIDVNSEWNKQEFCQCRALENGKQKTKEDMVAKLEPILDALNRSKLNKEAKRNMWMKMVTAATNLGRCDSHNQCRIGPAEHGHEEECLKTTVTTTEDATKIDEYYFCGVEEEGDLAQPARFQGFTFTQTSEPKTITKCACNIAINEERLTTLAEVQDYRTKLTETGGKKGEANKALDKWIDRCNAQLQCKFEDVEQNGDLIYDVRTKDFKDVNFRNECVIARERLEDGNLLDFYTCSVMPVGFDYLKIGNKVIGPQDSPPLPAKKNESCPCNVIEKGISVPFTKATQDLNATYTTFETDSQMSSSDKDWLLPRTKALIYHLEHCGINDHCEIEDIQNDDPMVMDARRRGTTYAALKQGCINMSIVVLANRSESQELQTCWTWAKSDTPPVNQSFRSAITDDATSTRQAYGIEFTESLQTKGGRKCICSVAMNHKRLSSANELQAERRNLEEVARKQNSEKAQKNADAMLRWLSRCDTQLECQPADVNRSDDLIFKNLKVLGWADDQIHSECVIIRQRTNKNDLLDVFTCSFLPEYGSSVTFGPIVVGSQENPPQPPPVWTTSTTSTIVSERISEASVPASSAITSTAGTTSVKHGDAGSTQSSGLSTGGSEPAKNDNDDSTVNTTKPDESAVLRQKESPTGTGSSEASCNSVVMVALSLAFAAVIRQ